MPNVFNIPKLSPIPFRLLTEGEDRYNTLPFDLQPTEKTLNGCYYQKWQTNDTTKLQLLSDYTPEDNDLVLKVYNLRTRAVVQTINFTEVVSNIVGQTFKVYECTVPFSTVGYYYAEISYTDENTDVIVYQSQPIHVAEIWPETLLFNYRNSYNDFAVVFETGISFDFRIEAALENFTPSFSDEMYVDQEYNSAQLSAVTYRVFTLNIGGVQGSIMVPDWAVDLANRILNVDTKYIDGVRYEKTDGAKFEITRAPGYPYAYATIEVQQVDEDFFLQRLQIGEMASGEYYLIQKVLQYIDNDADITISAKFRANTHLTRIAIINKGPDNFTLNVGTTNGGSELGSFAVTDTDLTMSILIGHQFDAAATLYLTGLTGTFCNIFVDYKQYDEDPVNINGGGGSSFRFPKGFSGWWSPIDSGDLAAHWDLSTGLGVVGTMYENCAIQDGRNGTVNKLGAGTMALDNLGNTALLRTFVGANDRTLTSANMPPHYHFIANGATSSTTLGVGDFRLALSKNDGINRDYLLTQTSNSADIGRTSLTGGSGGVAQSFDNRQRSVLELPFIAITD